MDEIFKRHVHDQLKEGRQAERVDREIAENLDGLLRHPGWPVYQGLLAKRLQAWGDLILTQAGSVDGMVTLEYVKGAMSGLILARDLPSVIVQAMKPAGPATDGEKQ